MQCLCVLVYWNGVLVASGPLPVLYKTIKPLKMKLVNSYLNGTNERRHREFSYWLYFNSRWRRGDPDALLL